jgi:hypothetical protein
MSKRYSMSLLGIAMAALGACAAHGPGGVAYDTQSSPPQATGATMGSGSGSISGGAAAPVKEQRANTPPGLDRDGHGPAAGAIVDPTGAVTGRK